MLNVEIIPDKNKYKLTFRQFSYELVEFCKRLQGARYYPKVKVWAVDRSFPNAIELHRNGHFYDTEIMSQVSGKDLEVADPETFNWEGCFQFPPLPHQAERAEEFAKISKGMLRGDMGVGKTYMAMMWLAAHQVNPTNVLVVCPTTLVRNWVNEFERFTGIEAIAVQGSKRDREKAFDKEGIHVVNYEYVVLNRQLRPDFKKLSKTTLILDESHKLKNHSSWRSKTFHRYSQDFTRILLMTGTPVSQGAQDYYSQFKCINPQLLGSSFSAFKNRYCETEQIRGAPVGVTRITGYRLLSELTSLIAPYLVNVSKEDCLDLPDKMYTVRYVDLSPEQSRDYKTLQREMALWVEGRSEDDQEPVTAANVLTRLIRLSQITQGFIPESDKEGAKYHTYKKNPKLDAMAEVLDDIPEPEPVLIICRFKHDVQMLRELCEKLKHTYAVIDGDVPPENRQDIATGFQNGRYKVLIGQIQTVGIGLNLDRASHVVFYSNNYSLVDRLQAEDRIHRATTKHAKCVYIDLVAQGTIDEEVISAIRNKKNVSDKLARLVLQNKQDDA